MLELGRELSVWPDTGPKRTGEAFQSLSGIFSKVRGALGISKPLNIMKKQLKFGVKHKPNKGWGIIIEHKKEKKNENT